MRVILIHGIHSPEGAHNMSALLPYIRRDLPGITVDLYEYGFMGFWEARWKNKIEAEKFADYLNEEDTVVVAHSNGAAVTYLACRDHGAKPHGVVAINPALDRWRTFRNVHWALTIHSDQDRVVDLAQWLPFNVWGDQGKVGYHGKSSRHQNVYASDHDGWPENMHYHAHCDLFDKARISDWSHYITDYIAERSII